ncbi:MAG: M43 family zinc metalloprotease, partial [Bacteroidota bacterium]
MMRFVGAVKHWILLAIILGCWALPGHAQLQRSCDTKDHMESLMDSYPQMRQRMKGIENHRLMISKGSFNGIRGDIVIPVVVHVVYNTAQQNISDAQVMSQINVLNQDFQRRNPDRIQTPDIFKPLAASARIRFELAKVDPQGNPTTGITRTQTRKSSFFTNTNAVKYGAMGGVDAWPTGQYLNIWVCPLAMGVLGYAQFPGGPVETDGVVINYKAFGTMGTVFAPFNLGRTTTHEVGHWLNLKHISGDGGCDVDDEVDDTPLCSRQHYGCMEGAVSCEGEDMVSNFMDYSDDKCMNLFTRGQAERMRALFAPGGFRHSLTKGNVLAPPIPVVEVKAPETIEVNALTASSAYISWADVEGAQSYRLQLRKADRPNWLTKVSSKTYISAIKLAPCTAYEVRLSAIFKEDESEFAQPITFTTEGCDQFFSQEDQFRIPSMFDPPVLSRETATLAWEPIESAIAYKVQYK